MATFSRVTLLALAAGVALGVSGCVAAPAVPVEPEPVPSASPAFASEEEALAAATEAYAAYLEVSDEITSQGGDRPDRIGPHVTQDYQAIEVGGFGKFKGNELFSEGESAFDSVQVQQFSDSWAAGTTFTVYLCSDISDVRLKDSSGVDVTSPKRSDRLPLEVDFYIAGAGPRGLLIDRSQVWAGTNFC